MLKKLIYIIGCSCLSMAASAQAVLFINAGSRAPWGNNQQLTIDANGNGKYYLRQLNGPLKDSISFNISTQQLDNLFNKAESTGFFSLNTEYRGKAVDGAGIYISMNNHGKKHHVEMVNTDLPVIKDWVAMLNNMLLPFRIRIYYGQH